MLLLYCLYVLCFTFYYTVKLFRDGLPPISKYLLLMGLGVLQIFMVDFITLVHASICGLGL